MGIEAEIAIIRRDLQNLKERETSSGTGTLHDPVTLDANADTLLSLSTQELGLDTQAANRVLAGPTSGAAAVPTMRALVAADLPAATTSAQGAVELATDAETQGGTDPDRAVTPAGLRSDVPTTPAASRGVRLDANGDVLLPAGGDVLPDGATDTDHGIDKRLRDVSGPVGVGDYGYNPAQIFTPSTWYLGTSAPLDDFFANNLGTIWSVVADCTQYQYVYSFPSWLYLRSDYNGGTYPNHAIWQTAIPSHAANDYYWMRALIANASTFNARIGIVLMQSDLKAGAAIWIKWVAASLYAQIETASYSSADAWLSQANAKTSSVAYTTDWTSRWTGTQVYADVLQPQAAALRVGASTVRTYTNQGLIMSKIQVNSFSLTFTPAYLFLFVEGNLSDRIVGLFDWVGKNIII